MRFLTYRIKRKSFFIILSLGLLALTSCQTEYTTQHFSFPPGSKPHENSWDYTALILVSSGERPITKKSKKIVQIKIYNKNKDTLLNESFEFVRASIKAKVQWKEFENITIELLEVGNEYAKDQYNMELLKSGPNKLLTINYEYDQLNKRFKKK